LSVKCSEALDVGKDCCARLAVVRSPGQIASVVLYRDAHLWNWVIYDSAGIWSGYLDGIRLDAPLEDASARLAVHVARNWNGHELPGPWMPKDEDSWSAGEPPPAEVDDADNWPQSPSHDWPSVFHAGDVVRLGDGRVAVVSCVMNYAPGPPPTWELVVLTLGWWGGPDHVMAMPWKCRPAPEAADEARRQGLL